MSSIIEINKSNTDILQVFVLMSEPQLLHYFEPAEGLFIAESPKVIERALNGGYEPYALLMEHKDIEGQMKELLCRCGDAPVYTAEFDEITAITGFKLIRGALCAFRRRALPTAEELCKNARRIAVLENVVNPTNIGAVIRSAAALGIDAVLLSYSCSDPLERRALRVSMGTAFQIPWTYIDKAADINDTLHELGFKTAAMALADDAISLASNFLKETDKLAIMIGNEGNGLPTDVIERADHKVIIPMYNGVDSLNAAAASAVAFWELRKDSTE